MRVLKNNNFCALNSFYRLQNRTQSVFTLNLSLLGYNLSLRKVWSWTQKYKRCPVWFWPGSENWNLLSHIRRTQTDTNISSPHPLYNGNAQFFQQKIKKMMKPAGFHPIILRKIRQQAAYYPEIRLRKKSASTLERWKIAYCGQKIIEIRRKYDTRMDIRRRACGDEFSRMRSE